MLIQGIYLALKLFQFLLLLILLDRALGNLLGLVRRNATITAGR
jgi:hypothetical protein